MSEHRFEQVGAREMSEMQRHAAAKFLEERYQDYFEKEYTIILAWSEGSLAGIVFYRIRTFEQILEAPIFFAGNNKELILELLNLLESEARKAGCQGILLIYKGGSAFEPLFDEILEQQGWDDPKNFKIRCIFHSPTFNPPWLHYRFKLPKTYQIFPWKKLKKDERAELKQLEGGGYPHEVSPFKKEERIDPLTSFGLRENGSVIGWLITHRIAPDLLLYDSFWTFPEHRAFGPNVMMLAKAIKLHIGEKITWGEAEADYELADHRWIQFFEKRLAPFSYRVERLYSAFKELN